LHSRVLKEESFFLQKNGRANFSPKALHPVRLGFSVYTYSGLACCGIRPTQNSKDVGYGLIALVVMTLWYVFGTQTGDDFTQKSF